MKLYQVLTRMASSKEEILSAAQDFIKFIDKAPSPYHAVHECQAMLTEAGFKEIKETESWKVKPLDKCFVTRNKSTIIAFAVGGKYQPGNGFTVVGAHTDSPCLRVKPVSRRVKHGFLQVGVECYGGGTWHTWFDRDLTVAGRVMVKNGSKIDHRLVHVKRPILRVPNLAIHLNREMSEKFQWNKETNLAPVLATSFQEQLTTGTQSAEIDDYSEQAEKHHPVLIQLLCEEMGAKPEQILDFELCLADTQPAAIGGALREFIFSPRLDNLLNAYCAAKGLMAACAGSDLDDETNIRMISLFDNEEVGSQSAQGAGSTMQELVLRRLSAGSNPTAFEESIPKSLMVSADQAHACHPNYGEKHEDRHRAGLHKGIVVKFNANQRYATTAITTSMLREVAARSNVPLQDIVVRNDSPCGSTIGPIMSAKLGMPTVDIGGPQLSMHSIREMCCTSSVLQSIQLYTGFFKHYPEVFASFNL